MSIKGFNQSGDTFRNKFGRAATGDSTGIDAVGQRSSVGLEATGGFITEYTAGGDVYRAHVFTSSGTFEVSSVGDFPDAIEYLVVAGGGGGGGSNAGGGGAGGLRTNVPGVQTADATPLTGSAFPAPATGGNGSGVYTCLLYTSPSPRDLSTSRMPSSA